MMHYAHPDNIDACGCPLTHGYRGNVTNDRRCMTCSYASLFEHYISELTKAIGVCKWDAGDLEFRRVNGQAFFGHFPSWWTEGSAPFLWPGIVSTLTSPSISP